MPQSLAYSPLGVVVSPPSEYLWNTHTPNYWSLPSQCLAAPYPRINVAEVTPVTFSTPTVQFAHTSKGLGSLIRISPKFDKIYRNDCHLTYWNQNCDILIGFKMPLCQWTTIVKLRPSRCTIFNFALKLWSYHRVSKKTPTHIIVYKLRNSCLILIIFDTKIAHIIWHRMTA